MNEQPSGEATSQSGEGVAQGATNEQPGDVAGAACCQFEPFHNQVSCVSGPTAP